MREDEVLEELGGGRVILQKKEGFRFGTDSVLLARWVLAREKGGSCLDLGTGSGIIPLLLAESPDIGPMTGLELQEEYADMARRSVEMNGLAGRVEILAGDLREAGGILPRGSFDIVVTNPPYKRAGSGIMSAAPSEAIARHEVSCTLEDVIASGAAMLRPGGRFYMINRPDRLVDALELMRKYRLEPKELQMVQPKACRAPSMFLVCGARGGGKQIKVAPALILDEDPGTVTTVTEKGTR